MTVRYFVDVECELCETVTTEQTRNAITARQRALDEGWTFYKGRDYCPFHARALEKELS